jgi:DNA-binding LacI/PurR family transcriptional regulator
LQTAPFQDAPRNIRRYIKDNPGLEGLILLGGSINIDVLKSLKAANVPHVVAGGNPRSIATCNVMADYVDGVVQAVHHLDARGHRRIALLNTTDYTVTSYEKLKGYRLGLALHNLSFTASMVSEGQPSAESGHAQLHELLRLHPDLDAVICADDYMAVGALRALQEQGRSVPQQVAVIGFHDYSVAGFTSPPLTTVRLDMEAMGSIAARLLWSAMQHELSEVWSVTVPTQLVVRGSA